MTLTLVASIPQRSTASIRICTSGKPSLPGTPASHSAGAPAAIRAPRSMSPLIPAAGSRIANRASVIDLEYACSARLMQTLPLALRVDRPEVFEDAFSLPEREARNRSQLGDGGGSHA